MLKSSASRTVLVILLVIAAFELGLSGKFSELWNLAFTPSGKANFVNGNINNPTSASQHAHQGGSA